jgi:hypothetical protein
MSDPAIRFVPPAQSERGEQPLGAPAASPPPAAGAPEPSPGGQLLPVWERGQEDGHDAVLARG